MRYGSGYGQKEGCYSDNQDGPVCELSAEPRNREVMDIGGEGLSDTKTETCPEN